MTILEKVEKKAAGIHSRNKEMLGGGLFNDGDWTMIKKICEMLESGEWTLAKAREVSLKWTRQAQDTENPWDWSKVDRIDFVIETIEGK